MIEEIGFLGTRSREPGNFDVILANKENLVEGVETTVISHEVTTICSTGGFFK